MTHPAIHHIHALERVVKVNIAGGPFSMAFIRMVAVACLMLACTSCHSICALGMMLWDGVDCIHARATTGQQLRWLPIHDHWAHEPVRSSAVLQEGSPGSTHPGLRASTTLANTWMLRSGRSLVRT